MSFYLNMNTSAIAAGFVGVYLCFWLLSCLSFIWMGGQFRADILQSYGPGLTFVVVILSP